MGQKEVINITYPNINYSTNKPIDKILAVIQNSKQIKPKEWMCQCPCHQDDKASLHITEAEDGRVLLKCHAGCDNRDIVKAWGLEMKNLFTARDKDESNKQERRILTTYDYKDLHGKLIFQTIRYEPKDFRQRRPDGKGDYIWNLQGVEPIPYRLPELKKALDDKKMILIVEGEKDVENLCKLGFTATCNHSGAGKWKESHSKCFPPGSKVIILPDNDDPGRKHGQSVAEQLVSCGCDVVIIELPGLPDKGDVSDWLKTYTKDELKQIIEEAWDGRPERQAESQNEAEKWAEPIPFLEYKRLPFPTEVLPDWGHGFVKALAKEMQVPEDMPGLLFLAALAAAISRAYKIEARPGWDEQLVLYILVLLVTGNRKSGAMREATAPLYYFEKKLIEEKRPEYEIRKHELDIFKAQMDDLKKSYVRARNGGSAKGTKSTGKTAAEIKADIEDLAREIAGTSEPAMPTLVTGDVTEEKLIKLAAENDGVICNFSAEGELFANASGKYNSNNSAFDALLKGYSGDPIRQDRIGRAAQYIDEPRFTVAASVQPIILKQLAAKPEFRHKGFLGRFLYAVPSSPLGYRQVNAEPIPKDVRDRYWNGILRLLAENWSSRETKILKLSPEANARLIEFEEQLEPKLRPEGELSPIVDWAAKLSGQLVRIAGLLHLAEHVADQEKPLIVEADTMARALALSEYLVNHCKIAYTTMDAADDIEILKAKRIIRWINEGHISEFTQRECHQALRATFYKVDELKEALMLLEYHGYIRAIPDQNDRIPGRKQKLFKVNPYAQNTIYTQNSPSANELNEKRVFCEFCVKTTKLKTEIEPVFWEDIGRYREGGQA